MNRFARLPIMLVTLLVMSLVVIGTGTAQEPAAGDGHLVVADPDAEALYFFALPDLDLVAELNHVSLLDHAGFLALPDGRLLFVDGETEELIAVQVDGAGAPAVVGRVPVPSPVSHFAVNPALTYAVVGAVDEDQPLTLVDLTSYTSRSFRVVAGEAGVMIGGDPLTVYHRNDELMQVEAYPVDQIAVSDYTPTGVVDTGAFGHGEAIHHGLGRLYLATDDGLDVVNLVEDGLAYHATLPWDTADRAGGRAYFVRLSNDGDYLLSYMAMRGDADTPWEDWDNDVYIADLQTDEATRIELGPGMVYRFALSDPYALFVNMHPDGDNANLLDTDSSSATFGQIVATIRLDPLTDGPQAGESPWGAEGRRVAITPDGMMGFVSHGGDGLISVIDTEARQVTRTLETPTSLHGGGYMIVVAPDMVFTDTVAR